MSRRKPMSMRKMVRLARLQMPDADPRKALFIYRKMNDAVRQLQQIIAEDLLKSKCDHGKRYGEYCQQCDERAVEEENLNSELFGCSACGSTGHDFADCPQNPISRAAVEQWIEFEGRDPRAY